MKKIIAVIVIVSIIAYFTKVKFINLIKGVQSETDGNDTTE